MNNQKFIYENIQYIKRSTSSRMFQFYAMHVRSTIYTPSYIPMHKSVMKEGIINMSSDNV